MNWPANGNNVRRQPIRGGQWPYGACGCAVLHACVSAAAGATWKAPARFPAKLPSSQMSLSDLWACDGDQLAAQEMSMLAKLGSLCEGQGGALATKPRPHEHISFWPAGWNFCKFGDQ